MHRNLGLISSCPRFELQTSFLNFCHTLIGLQSFPILLVSNSRPHSYLNDDKIQDFVERNLCKLLLLLVLIILVLFGSVRSFLKRSLKRRCASIFWRVENFRVLLCFVLCLEAYEASQRNVAHVRTATASNNQSCNSCAAFLRRAPRFAATTQACAGTTATSKRSCTTSGSRATSSPTPRAHTTS